MLPNKTYILLQAKGLRKCISLRSCCGFVHSAFPSVVKEHCVEQDTTPQTRRRTRGTERSTAKHNQKRRSTRDERELVFIFVASHSLSRARTPIASGSSCILPTHTHVAQRISGNADDAHASPGVACLLVYAAGFAGKLMLLFPTPALPALTAFHA